MLSEQQVHQYHEDGYITPDFRLSQEMIDEIRVLHDRLLVKHPEFTNYCPNVLAYDTGFLNFARIPEILDMVGQVIGPNFALWNSSFFAKPAHGGHATPWHQDGEYWPLRPLATCTVWIAIDRATPENGCLRMIRGSHKERKLRKHNTNNAANLTLNQELDPSEYDESDAVDLVLEPGQISLHDIYLLHGSEANNSPDSRRGMTLRYMPTSTVFDRAKARELHEKHGFLNHADRTLYLMRGIDESRQNDFRIRL
ncbi:hypothetical protein AB833_26195 [Chromatiales bacterium (ex Bugula neritina AB1)]|nr:hypothetical protein AB833_26195 [Chromatiales bacterium (ex Bugula neritina AB1)]